MSTKKLQIIGNLGGSVEVDTTLAQSGKAADAKATGDAINNLSNLVGDTAVSKQISDAVASKSDIGHTHNYAGSSSAGGAATSANKLNTNAGGTIQPVYFANGIPVETTYTLGANVPSDAKFTDTVYTHPTTSGNKHIPSGGSSGQILRWSADGTAVWGADNNTTYSNATTTADGLMSAADKIILNNLDTFVGDRSVSEQIHSAFTDNVITIEEINAICGTVIYSADEVEL